MRVAVRSAASEHAPSPPINAREVVLGALVHHSEGGTHYTFGAFLQDVYNLQRLHSEPAYQSPMEFELTKPLAAVVR